MSDKIVTIGDRQFELTLERDGATWRAGEQVVEVLSVRDEEMEVRVGGRLQVVPYLVHGGSVTFTHDGETYVADVGEKGAGTRARHREQSTAAPMPGLVLKILVKPGDVLTRGTPLLILEAMKMEHQIVAPRDGTVAAVHCAEGELVQPGVELVTMKEEPGASGKS